MPSLLNESPFFEDIITQFADESQEEYQNNSEKLFHSYEDGAKISQDVKDVFGFTIRKGARVNEDLLEELSIHDPTAEVDIDGNVTVYHRTTEENARQIYNSGIMTAEEDALFFSSKENGYAGDYGDTVVTLKVPSTVLEVNDIFDGEVHFDIPLQYRNGRFSMNVSRYLVGDADTRHSYEDDINKTIDKWSREAKARAGRSTAMGTEAGKAIIPKEK